MCTVGGLPAWVNNELPHIKRRFSHAFHGHPKHMIKKYVNNFYQCTGCLALITLYDEEEKCLTNNLPPNNNS
jgi:hypothetical protein